MSPSPTPDEERSVGRDVARDLRASDDPTPVEPTLRQLVTDLGESQRARADALEAEIDALKTARAAERKWALGVIAGNLGALLVLVFWSGAWHTDVTRGLEDVAVALEWQKDHDGCGFCRPAAAWQARAEGRLTALENTLSDHKALDQRRIDRLYERVDDLMKWRRDKGG